MPWCCRGAGVVLVSSRGGRRPRGAHRGPGSCCHGGSPQAQHQGNWWDNGYVFFLSDDLLNEWLASDSLLLKLRTPCCISESCITQLRIHTASENVEFSDRQWKATRVQSVLIYICGAKIIFWDMLPTCQWVCASLEHYGLKRMLKASFVNIVLTKHNQTLVHSAANMHTCLS